jgi:hypothetical protein
MQYHYQVGRGIGELVLEAREVTELLAKNQKARALFKGGVILKTFFKGPTEVCALFRAKKVPIPNLKGMTSEELVDEVSALYDDKPLIKADDTKTAQLQFHRGFLDVVKDMPYDPKMTVKEVRNFVKSNSVIPENLFPALEGMLKRENDGLVSVFMGKEELPTEALVGKMFYTLLSPDGLLTSTTLQSLMTSELINEYKLKATALGVDPTDYLLACATLRSQPKTAKRAQQGVNNFSDSSLDFVLELLSTVL